jgi:hypothetical protein
VFGVLLARCESWNLGGHVQKNKQRNRSTPCDPKEQELPLCEDDRRISDYYDMGEQLGAGMPV